MIIICNFKFYSVAFCSRPSHLWQNTFYSNPHSCEHRQVEVKVSFYFRCHTHTHFAVYWAPSAVIARLTYTLYCAWNTPCVDTDGGLKLQLPCLWCAACVDNVSELEHQDPLLVPTQTRPLDSLMDGLWDNGPLGVHTLSAVARWPHRYTDLLFPSADL